jgi:hypothetical protein
MAASMADPILGELMKREPQTFRLLNMPAGLLSISSAL